MSSCSTDEFHEKFKNKDYKVYQSLLMSDQNMASSQQDHHLFASDTMKCASITIGFPLHNFKIKIFSPRKQLVTLQESIGSLLPQLGGKRNVQLVLQLLTPATWGSRIQLILGSDGDG